MMLQGNEKEGIVERLKECLANKNKDLTEREGDVGGGQRGSRVPPGLSIA